MGELGVKILNAREAAGLSLREVAEASGGRLTPGGLSMIEQGKRYPTLRTLEALSRVLQLRITVTPSGVRLEKERRRVAA
jgi:transcriptional regulator with XRE-family HTH domain